MASGYSMTNITAFGTRRRARNAEGFANRDERRNPGKPIVRHEHKHSRTILHFDLQQNLEPADSAFL
jgi:hypothetical protein